MGTANRPKEWSTLAGRLRWLVRIYGSAGTPGGTLSSASGLTRQHLGIAIKRLEKGQDVGVAVLEGIARATNASAEWLLLGRGEPGVEPVRDRLRLRELATVERERREAANAAEPKPTKRGKAKARHSTFPPN